MNIEIKKTVSAPFFLKIKKRNEFIESSIFECYNKNLPALGAHTKNFKDSLKVTKKNLSKARINSVNVLILKIINFIVKIFNKKFISINNILEANKKCNLLLKTISQIKNTDKTKVEHLHNFNELSKDELSPFEIVQCQLQKLHYDSLVTALKKFGDALDQKDLNLSKSAFKILPPYLQKCLLKLAALHELNDVPNNPALLRSKVADKSSIYGIALDYLSSQVQNYENIVQAINKNNSLEVNEIRKKILKNDQFINNLFDSRIKKDKNFSYDISIERLLSHLPENAIDKPITVTMVAVEYAGLVKQGGLAEAVEGLCQGVKEENSKNKLQLVFPYFSHLPKNILNNMGEGVSYTTQKGESYKVFTQDLNGVKCFFIEHAAFVLNGEKVDIYGPDYPSVANRYSTFSELAAEFIYELNNSDIIHLHDWHTSAVAMKLKKEHKTEWKNGQIPPIVFTFHNNGRNSQGRVCMGPYNYDPVIEGLRYKGILKNNDNLFVKTLKIVDAVTTVSETFARDAQKVEYGEGVSFAVRQAAKVGKLTGIINGTNLSRWNPKTESSLVNWKDPETGEIVDLSFSSDDNDIFAKKSLCKQQLKKWICQNFPDKKFDETKPLICYIGRYDSSQKGLDLLHEAITTTLKNGGQFICMGSSEDPTAKKLLDLLEKKHKNDILIIRDYINSEGKFHYQQGNETKCGIGALVRAATDFNYIPSKFEPCGLVQFEAWLFAALVIASKTGGLADTVFSHEDHKSTFNGFLFDRDSKSNSSILAIKKALTLWKNSSHTEKNDHLKRVMKSGKNYGWSYRRGKYSPSQQYRFVYENGKENAKNRNKVDTQIDKIEELKHIIPHHSKEMKITKNEIREEQYLAYYYSGKLDSKSLDSYYQLLRKNVRAQVPSPYGCNVEYKNYEKYGAFVTQDGVKFNLLAPGAKKVNVCLVNTQDKTLRKEPLIKDLDGTWSLKLSDIKEGQNYYYEINGQLKIDPYARFFAPFDPAISKVPYAVVSKDSFVWTDKEWIDKRIKNVDKSLPISIFELHPAYWERTDGNPPNYRELAVKLVEHCKSQGYTHVELMAILEHPDEKSWGYQVSGFFAPNSRLGTIEDFKFMINHLHENNIGAILDWIPAHFSKADFGLKNFDGSSLYEAKGLKYFFSIRRHFFKYDSKHFNFNKKEIREFLFSSAMYWLKEMHFDGLRVDCVRSILSSENKEAADLFLRDFNAIVHKNSQGCITIAEEFSGDRRITASYYRKGLGFDLKWHAGWLNSTISYFKKPLETRKKNYNEIINAINCDNFSKQVNFISHDQVSHSYDNLINICKNLKNEEEKHANFNALFSFMMCSPGKKLFFMGEDFGSHIKWDTLIGTGKGVVDGVLVESQRKKQIKSLIHHMNQLYRTEEPMYEQDENGELLEWIPDNQKVVHAYRRKAKNGNACAIFHNFTDQHVQEFIVPKPKYSADKTLKIEEIFTTENENFGGKGRRNLKIEERKESYVLTIPPLSTIVVKESTTF